ncbi:ATP-grasp domain-containing protein [Gynuella sp.]|uniref:ATP-grasp domain-containing protein n=1 Tax=Gynuella sp. TaxID=2969146 RepID=UPI003D1375B2
MKHLLVLAQGTPRTFINVHGKSVFENLPFPVIVLCERRKAIHYEGLTTATAPIIVESIRFRDKEAVARTAAQWHEQVGLSGVVAVDERTVEFAAELRKSLNLGGMMPNIAERFRNKVVMKQCLKPTNLRLPEYVDCDDRQQVETLLSKHRKIIIKPVDGSGSKSVTEINSSDDLADWYTRTRDVSGYEAEEFIEGTLYHINAIVRDGEILLSAVAPYIPNAANIDFTSGKPMISVLELDGSVKEKMDRYSEQVIQTLGIKNGITHMECFLTPEEDVVFCEIAARQAGGGLILMIEAQYQVNYVEAMMLIEAGFGEQVVVATPAANLMALIGFRQCQFGIVKAAPDKSMFAEQWIRYQELPALEGTMITPSSHCTDYVGLLVFESENLGEFNLRSQELNERFNRHFDVAPA